jgi:hypothetical protein
MGCRRNAAQPGARNSYQGNHLAFGGDSGCGGEYRKREFVRSLLCVRLGEHEIEAGILHSGICDGCAFHVCARLHLLYGLGRRRARANITLDVYLRLTKMCVAAVPLPLCRTLPVFCVDHPKHSRSEYMSETSIFWEETIQPGATCSQNRWTRSSESWDWEIRNYSQVGRNTEGNVPLATRLCLDCNCPAQFVQARSEEIQVLLHSLGRLGGEL